MDNIFVTDALQAKLHLSLTPGSGGLIPGNKNMKSSRWTDRRTEIYFRVYNPLLCCSN